MANRYRNAGYIGWLLGVAIWFFGYFVPGNPALLDWSITPWWIADFFPTIESEIGMMFMLVSAVALMCISMVAATSQLFSGENDRQAPNVRKSSPRQLTRTRLR
jgi:hypothetical protein